MADQINSLDFACCDNPARRVFTAVGRNPDVDSGTDEDIWPVGGDYPFTAVDAACEIFSDNAADGVAGTGAQKVTIIGLSGGLFTSEVVSTNGLTPVALLNQYSRIFFTEITQAGSNLSNVGTITVQQTAGPLVLGQINPNAGNVLNGIFTVPNNWNSVRITSVTATVGRSAAGDFLEGVLQYRPGSIGGWTTIGIADLQSDGTSAFNLQGTGRTLFPPGYDLRIRAVNAGTNNNAITGAFTVNEQ